MEAKRVTFVGSSFPPNNTLPLGPLMLEASVRRSIQNITTNRVILEVMHEALTVSDEDLDRVKNTHPDVLCLTCRDWDTFALMDLGAKIRKTTPDIVIMAGGPTVSSWGPDFLCRWPVVDVAVFGEGEERLPLLLSCDRSGWENVPGIAYRDKQGRVVTTDAKYLPQDMSSIPDPFSDGIVAGPQYELFMEFSRGCVHHCRYCAWGNFGRRLRLASEDRIRKQLHEASQLGCQDVFMTDSAINVIPEHLETVTKAFEEWPKDSPIKVEFFLDLRSLTSEAACRLARLRAGNAEIGINTVNEESARLITRTSIPPDEIDRRLGMIGSNIDLNLHLILGLPGDGPDGFLRSCDYMHRLVTRHSKGRFVGVRVFWLLAGRGTELWALRDELKLSIREEGMPYVMSSVGFTYDDMIRSVEALTKHPVFETVIMDGPPEILRAFGASPPLGLIIGPRSYICSPSNPPAVSM